jgi:hypothetical protein
VFSSGEISSEPPKVWCIGEAASTACAYSSSLHAREARATVATRCPSVRVCRFITTDLPAGESLFNRVQIASTSLFHESSEYSTFGWSSGPSDRGTPQWAPMPAIDRSIRGRQMRRIERDEIVETSRRVSRGGRRARRASGAVVDLASGGRIAARHDPIPMLEHIAQAMLGAVRCTRCPAGAFAAVPDREARGRPIRRAIPKAWLRPNLKELRKPRFSRSCRAPASWTSAFLSAY